MKSCRHFRTRSPSPSIFLRVFYESNSQTWNRGSETESGSARREDFIAFDGAFYRLFDVSQSAIRNAQLKRIVGIAETVILKNQ